MIFNYDCKYFTGEKPCKYKRLCEDCPEYLPAGYRILIIKLAAMGDVLRTTPLLTGLKRVYPKSCITWVTAKESIPLLEDNPLIDKLIEFKYKETAALYPQHFDLVISLDKDTSSTALAARMQSMRKMGFGLNAYGTVYPLNSEAEYAFRLGLDDELKFRQNQKSYPEIIFEACGLKFDPGKDAYIFELHQKHLAFGEEFLRKAGLKPPADLIVGLNTGTGKVWKTKEWPEEHFSTLAKRLIDELGAKVVLLGGEDEKEKNGQMLKNLPEGAVMSGVNPIKDFAGIMNACDVIVTGDTVALHLAIALRKKTVALFGPTSDIEIDMYGQGVKLKTGIDCSPCYKSTCAEELACMKNLDPDTVFTSIRSLVKK